MADLDEGPRPRKRGARRPGGGSKLPDTPDAVEIAMKAVNSGGNPDGPAAALLVNQNALVRSQIEELRLKKMSRVGIMVLTAAVLLGLIAMAWQASRSTALIVEPFQVPPALAQRGLTGEVVAARLLDRLSSIQNVTQSARAASSFSNNWQDNIKLAVPQTGVSAGELWRLMRSSFGNETRITGEVVVMPAGLAVTARAGAVPGQTFEGPPAALDDLLLKSAESIFRATQPYRYGVYVSRDRSVADEEVLLELAEHESPVERKWAFNGLSVNRRASGQLHEAVRMADRALAIDPKMPTALSNKALALSALGREEAALHAYRAAAATSRTSNELDPRLAREHIKQDVQNEAFRVGDFRGVIDTVVDELEGRRTTSRRSAIQAMSFALIRSHDYSAGIKWARKISPDPAGGFTHNESTLAVARRLLAVALAVRDPGLARTSVQAVESAVARVEGEEAADGERFGGLIRRTALWPQVAVAKALTGNFGGARQLASRTPRDCYSCVLSRGQIAALAGEREEAVRWFAEAVRQGPSIPFAYSDWGELLLESGDVDGAVAKFAMANRVGPKWADPLKYWGDAMMRYGRHREAVRKYAAAAERSQRWGALHLNWGKALWQAGKHDLARAKLRAATKMDLGAADREELQRILVKAG